jgi:hypothetical protein
MSFFCDGPGVRGVAGNDPPIALAQGRHSVDRAAYGIAANGFTFSLEQGEDAHAVLAGIFWQPGTKQLREGGEEVPLLDEPGQLFARSYNLYKLDGHNEFIRLNSMSKKATFQT